MVRFLVDEDLPRPLAAALRGQGDDAVHVRDAGHAGAEDEVVFALAKKEDRALIAADLGFADVRRFPLGDHPGLVVARLPNEWTVQALVNSIVAGIKSVPSDEIRGALVIVEPHRIRVRR